MNGREREIKTKTKKKTQKNADLALVSNQNKAKHVICHNSLCFSLVRKMIMKMVFEFKSLFGIFLKGVNVRKRN